MILPTVIELTRPGVKATLDRAADGALWYVIAYGEGRTFEFPVPFEDTKGGTFNPTDDASVFRRWIRKRLEMLSVLRGQPMGTCDPDICADDCPGKRKT